MKRLLLSIVILILLFNWIGYQLYSTFYEETIHQPINTKIDQKIFRESPSTTCKMASFYLRFYEKDIDFDDFFEFTAAPGYSVNEIFINLSNDLFTCHPDKENRSAGFKCFNGEYFSGADRLFTKYHNVHCSGKIPDRYLLKIPTVFLSPKDLPPQHIG